MQTVDVIIPTYKPDKTLIQLVQMLQKQTVPVRQIIILNTEERYFTQAACSVSFWQQDNIAVYHHSEQEFDHGRTRDAGVQRSDAAFFVCMTQDAVPADAYLIKRLLAPFADSAVAAVYARQLPGENANSIERFTRQFNYPAESAVKSKEDIARLGIKAFFCSNVCAAYRRDIYDETGGFIRHTIFNEDMIYAAKAIQHGYKVAYAADARVVHSHNYTNLQQFRRNFDIGVSQAQHPEVFAHVSSEGEGKKLVRLTLKHLKKQHQLYKVPGFLMTCACKLSGYRLGKQYRTLPRFLVRWCTMSQNYWT